MSQGQKQIKPQPKNTPVTEEVKPKWLKWIGFILLITLVAYLPLFSGEKEFTNWDDDGYVTDQPLVKSLSSENIGKIFDQSSTVILNYHPITMLSLAIDYSRGYDEDTNTLSITPFATTNLIIHLLNTALVFIFLYKLSSKRIWIAAFAALFFGIHPMHVESVAWISERKDLLYCFFFLLSAIAYMEYKARKNYLLLAASFILFVLSCLSKAMAVPLPLVLFLIDYLERRKVTARTILEKLPYFLFAIWIGYFTLQIQTKAIGDIASFNFVERLIFASYGFCIYLVKLLVPLHLSAFYPYPTEGLPVLYYLMPVVAAFILVFPFLFFRKNPGLVREINWGTGFYILMVALVLQFVSVGRALMADRYTYVAYIGPLFIIGVFVHDFIQTPQYRKIALGVSGLFAIVFIALTWQRVQVWDNGKTLWADVIEKYPYEFSGEGANRTVVKTGVKTAYKNMADYYAAQQMFDSAYIYYQILEMAGTNDAEVYSNIGNIYAIRNDMPNALAAFSKSIAYDSANAETYLKRGLMYARNGKHAEAIADLNKVIQAQPGNEEAYVFRSRSMLSMGDFDALVAASAVALKQFPNNPDLWFCRGLAYISLQNYNAGINDLQQAIKLNPNSGLYYYNLASAYDKAGQKGPALQNAQLAKQYGFPVADEFMKKLEN